jgi:DNA repair exonuclease SbcCD nuclease subunit
MKFLHLSDLHIHTHNKDNVKVRSMLNYLEKISGSLLDTHRGCY